MLPKQPLRAERRAAPKLARIPLGAEAGLVKPGGLHSPAEGLRHLPLRGLQGRSTYSATEGLS